ncbi:MAG TPA: outer membrane beta-barrel protein [Bacteroidales bacterium]|nr:outer membrane beta-barrel protein [Bacteroidales bacterium]
MRRFILFSLVIFLCAPYSGAQLWKMKRYEVTAGIGTSQFYGDVGGYTIGENVLGLKDLTLKQTRFNVNGAFRYFFTDYLAARLNLSYLMLHATDERGSNENRRYDAVTSVFEPSLIGEYYFVRNRERNSFLFQTYRGRSRNRVKDFFRSIDVYALTGFGGAGFIVNPNDALEARGLPTRGFTAIVPLGLGAKLAFDPNILFGIELTGRYSFSDHLDGYTSQWSARNDVYHTFSVTFNYRIKTARNGLPSFR